MIIYALVATPPLVLCEFSEKGGNFPAVAKRLVQQAVGMADVKKSFQAQITIFHYVIDEAGIMYLCLAEQETNSRLAFSFLSSLQQLFRSQYELSELRGMGENALSDGFSRTIKDRLDFFNHDPSADKFKVIQTEIDTVKKVMVENIDKVLDRGDKIEMLVTQTEEMDNQAYGFRKSSVALQRSLCIKNVKLWICIAILLVFIICLLAFIGYVIVVVLHLADGESFGHAAT